MRRVVVTGMGGITALGDSWSEIKANMLSNKTAIKYMVEWEDIKGMNTKLGAPIPVKDLRSLWPRKSTRTMGPVALYSIYATEKALRHAGLIDNLVIKNGRTGVAYGSSFGSPGPISDFANLLFERNINKITATSYIRMMSHTTAVNIGLFFGTTGRIIPCSTACTSGSLAIGYGAEAIRNGYQDVVIAGGAEEICPSMAATFDVLYATSTNNSNPELVPRPFDKNRDGIVIGEGAATLILEEYEHAVNRGANIYAEVVGFGSNTDGVHVTHPSAETMAIAIRLALDNAKLQPKQIGFISAHGTATKHGDIAETIATSLVFNKDIPIHSIKSYLGHTLGAAGSIEAWLAIEMMLDNWFAPTANLRQVDENCGELDYLMGAGRTLQVENVMSNNFAFGGINTSLIFSREKL
jgi:3-oxoacyl-[acyl-carrier-protein] synthase II